jgi:hypothetical protein
VGDVDTRLLERLRARRALAPSPPSRPQATSREIFLEVLERLRHRLAEEKAELASADAARSSRR